MVFPDKPTVLMHTKDAAKYGIASGNMTVVFNDREEHKAVAIVSDNFPLTLLNLRD